MSQLFATLKKEVMLARKNKDKAKSGVGLVLIGEVETEAKRNGSELNDQAIIAKIKKLIESNREMIAHSQDEAKIGVLNEEIAFLETFLPKQLSEGELRQIISDSGLNHIGAIMGHLKKNYAGQFDGPLASKVAKEVS